MKKIKLTSRLDAVASLIEPCDTIADIGTDHGFLPTFLIQNEICKSAIASDINEGPLKSSMRTAQTYSVSDKLEFICAPGLDGVAPGSVDTVVIAGMGGETIVEILKAASWVKDHKTKLVLQPQSKFELFENYLNENGFSVEKALLVKDAGRLYIAFLVQYTGNVNDSDIRYFADYLKQDQLFSEYVNGILKKLTLREQGLKTATNPDTDELFFIEKTVNYLKNAVMEVKSDDNC